VSAGGFAWARVARALTGHAYELRVDTRVGDVQAKVALLDTSITRSASHALEATSEGTEIVTDKCTFFSNAGKEQAVHAGAIISVGARSSAKLCAQNAPPNPGLEIPDIEFRNLDEDGVSIRSTRARMARLLCVYH
jgi:hypothetical protein